MEDESIDFRPDDNQVTYNNDEFCKYWHKTGFITFGYWAQGDRVTVEIGALESGGGLKSATKCFLPAMKFLTYVQAETFGTLSAVLPTYDASGVSFYGGANTPNGPVSRVFKSHWWTYGADKKLDKTARVFKCGHFKGNVTSTGAITPKLDSPLSADSMKLTLEQIAEVYNRLQQRITVESLEKLLPSKK